MAANRAEPAYRWADHSGHRGGPAGWRRPDRVYRTVALPGGGRRVDSFDLLGRLVMRTEPDDSWLRCRYADGRLERVEHSSGQWAAYEFDAARRTLTARTARTVTTVTVGEDGLPAGVALEVDGHSWSVGYQWARPGLPPGIVYPGGAPLAFVPDGADGGSLRATGQEYCRVSAGRGRGRVHVAFADGTVTTEKVGPGRPPVLTGATLAGACGPEIAVTYRHDSGGRIVRAGGRTYAYDEAGRLASAHGLTAGGARVAGDAEGGAPCAFGYDEHGRLARIERGRRARVRTYAGDGRAVTGLLDGSSGETARFRLDALGRRVARHDKHGITRYRYDMFGHLSRVDLPGGRSVSYVYDGLGRLVAREADGAIRYFVTGFDGHRLAEAGPDGAVLRSYLWLGPRCVGRVDGPPGNPLAMSFHRLPGTGVSAVGHASGELEVTESGDPYGADHPVRDGVPGYAELFGDPGTGLLLAGTRWLDPATGQFLSPDSWSFEDPAMPARAAVRRLLRTVPGGPARPEVDHRGGYDWCDHDPVNRLDPSGHNWLGLIFSVISGLLWSMQETSVALEFYVLDIFLEILLLFPGFREVWDSSGYWRDSVFNLVPPTASYRLMVPLAINLNGLSRGGAGAVWTLGNVIWGTGDEFRHDARNATRDLVLCSNASQYLAAVNEQVADVFRVRNDPTKTQGTCNASGKTLTATTLPGGMAAATVFAADDWILVKLTAGGQPDEPVRVSGVSGSDLDITPDLPAPLRGQAVEWTRLDRASIRMERDTRRVTRPVTFVRGQAIHYGRRVDDDAIAADQLQVSEFLPAADRKSQVVSFPAEQSLLRLNSDGDRSGYTVNDVVRIQNGPAYLARVVTELHGTRDLVVDPPLAAGTYRDLGLARLARASDAPASPMAIRTGPAGASDRVEAGRLTGLSVLDGIEISTGGGAPATERRIVTGLLLDVAVAALPAALRGVPVRVDLLAPDRSVKADGAMAGPDGTRLTFAAGQTGRFSAGQPVRVSAGGTDGYGVVAAGSTDAEMHLTEALPLPAFGDGTGVQVVLMASAGTFDAESTPPAGDHVVIKVSRGDAAAAGQQLRVRPAASADGGAVRVVSADPVVVAAVDSGLPPAFTTGLSVQRLVADAASRRSRVQAPAVHHRLSFTGPGHGLAPGDVLAIMGNVGMPRYEEWVITEVTAVAGPTVTVADYVETSLSVVTTSVVAATGPSSADGKLGDALVLIPSDPGREPLGRRESVQNHEMRHVWQYAVWGPFFFSFPLPWLFHLGFSFGDRSHDVSQVVRHIGLGGLDSLVALAVWGMGGKAPDTTLPGQVADADRKTVVFGGSPDAAMVAKFSAGSSVQVTEGGVDTFNVIDALTADQDRITLRFALEHAAQGDAVQVNVSPFEQVRKTINTMFNFEQLWSSHIPQAWGRALSNILNRDSWFPGLGWYPLAALVAGFDQSRISFEQDASYQSGDTYTNIVVARPGTVFVGQLAKLYVFMNNRETTISELLNVSSQPLQLLTVELPPDPAGPAAVAAKVPGAVLIGTSNEVRFRENRFIRMGDQVENTVGVYFAAGQPGDYKLHNAGALPADRVVFKGFAATDFLKLATLTVKPLGVSPDPAADIFETEEVTVSVTGDTAAAYALRFSPGPAGKGRITGLRYSAPQLLVGAGSIQENVQITATYPPDLAFLRTGGELPHALTAADLTNVCQEHQLTVRELTVPAVGPVTAGTTAEFQMGIAPVSVTVTSAAPAGAIRNASVQNLGGRPARLKFVAPDRVNAAAAVTFDMVFGTDPAVRKTVTVSVQIMPAP